MTADVQVIYQTALTCCRGSAESFDEPSACVYNGVIKDFFDHMSESLGRERAERLAKWLNGKELFRKYTIYNRFCDFTFDGE